MSKIDEMKITIESDVSFEKCAKKLRWFRPRQFESEIREIYLKVCAIMQVAPLTLGAIQELKLQDAPKKKK